MKDDCEKWFAAQCIDPPSENHESDTADLPQPRWSPPPTGRVKCNIGASWCRGKELGGMSWVVRDFNGVILWHHRDITLNVSSREAAHALSLQWAVQSVSDLS